MGLAILALTLAFALTFCGILALKTLVLQISLPILNTLDILIHVLIAEGGGLVFLFRKGSLPALAGVVEPIPKIRNLSIAKAGRPVS